MSCMWGCISLGMEVLFGSTQKLERAAARGDSEAQYQLGRHVMHLGATEENRAKGLEWYHQAAAGGHAVAQSELGHLYYGGHSALTKNEAKGLELLKSSAASGNGSAQSRLGEIYY